MLPPGRAQPGGQVHPGPVVVDAEQRFEPGQPHPYMYLVVIGLVGHPTIVAPAVAPDGYVLIVVVWIVVASWPSMFEARATVSATSPPAATLASW